MNEPLTVERCKALYIAAGYDPDYADKRAALLQQAQLIAQTQ